MSLTYNQVRLVKATIPAIRQDGERIATLFYTNMIRDHPDLHAFFNPVNMGRGHQPRAFCAMMLSFASNINDISELVNRMEKVAQKHASIMVSPDQYNTTGEYLLRAFGEVLGDAWTTPTREAWEKAYAIMAGMLTRREALIYRDFGAWIGWRRFVVRRRWTELSGGDGDYVTFEVRPEDGKKLPPFHPGQYVSVRLTTPGRSHPQLRQYYICGAPSASTYRFTVRRDIGREFEPFNDPDRTLAAAAHFSSSRTSFSPRSPSRSRRGSGSTGSSRPGTPMTDASHASASTTGTSAPSLRSRPGVVSTMLIDSVQEGDVLELTHPAGEFIFDVDAIGSNHKSPLILISAGVGAGPLQGILSTMLSQGSPNRPIAWIHASRHKALYGDKIRELTKRFPNLKASFFKSRLADSEVLAYTLDFANDLSSARITPQDFHVQNHLSDYYVCGPHKFLLEMKKYLEGHGVEPARVRFGMLSIGAMDKKD